MIIKAENDENGQIPEGLWVAGCHREGWYFWCGKELKFIGPYPSFTHAFEAEQEKDDGGVY